MMMANPEPDKPPSSFPDYSKAWLDQLAGEYRIIQDKIDKIAGVRITVRGWSVTLVVAFAFGANTLKLPPYWVLSALLPVTAFLLMERAQARYGDILGARAVRIEKRIWRILRISAPEGSEVVVGGMAPHIAHELGEESQFAHPAIQRFQSMGYIVFYGVQIVLVIVAAVWLGQLQQQTVREGQQPSTLIINNLSPEASGATKGVPNGQTRSDRRQP